MPYAIEVTPAAQRDLHALERQVVRRIDARIRKLAEDPRPATVEKVKAFDGGDLYRVRVGDYRILYTIEDNRLLILVIRVRHRREVYRKL